MDEKDVKFIDLFNPKQPRTNKDELKRRLEICLECPLFNAQKRKCTRCGCFMDLKATLHSARCPVGRW